MKREDLEAVIPVALAELRDVGLEAAYFDEIGRQVTLHDEVYLHRRQTARRFLGYVGINIRELPSGFSHPGTAKMYPALLKLEKQGIIAGKFEETTEDDRPRRILYQLASPPAELEG
jgi:hypothetical protein